MKWTTFGSSEFYKLSFNSGSTLQTCFFRVHLFKHLMTLLLQEKRLQQEEALDFNQSCQLSVRFLSYRELNAQYLIDTNEKA